VRTLIVGLPLPNAQFDNHSFISAPSFADYQRIVVDMASVSRVIDDVVNGTGAHSTYGGQAVVNGETSPHAFSLPDLLAMRRRETDWLIAHGGLVVLIGQPVVPHARVGASGDQPNTNEPWHSYAWLPEPEMFSYRTDLLPGFGRPGAVLVDGEHPFAPMIKALAQRLAYRIYISEDQPAVAETGHVFARSEGGIPIAWDMRAGEGQLVFLPTILKPETDRQITANALSESLERWDARPALPSTIESTAKEAT
jgi:hypothetical protein